MYGFFDTVANRKKLVKNPTGVSRGCSKELHVKGTYFSTLFLTFKRTRDY